MPNIEHLERKAISNVEKSNNFIAWKINGPVDIKCFMLWKDSSYHHHDGKLWRKKLKCSCSEANKLSEDF